MRALVVYGKEIILCSDKGVFCSTNKVSSWFRRSSESNFIDLQDTGKELLAVSADGHLYCSTNKGSSWSADNYS